MSDPIADIIEETHGWNENYTPYKIEEAAKQIRQKIGRELLTERNLFNHTSGDNFVREDIIREVCQLEES